MTDEVLWDPIQEILNKARESVINTEIGGPVSLLEADDIRPIIQRVHLEGMEDTIRILRDTIVQYFDVAQNEHGMAHRGVIRQLGQSLIRKFDDEVKP